MGYVPHTRSRLGARAIHDCLLISETPCACRCEGFFLFCGCGCKIVSPTNAPTKHPQKIKKLIINILHVVFEFPHIIAFNNGAARKSGLDEIGTHTLRKTFGYHVYQRTKDMATLQMIFNHSHQSMTVRYIGITQDLIDDAVSGFSL
ncbi:tyrosine-type recombinase/integrase [Brevibacillus brevis]|uniref:Tyrosine-type recombinase/integrase n=1 Tax=Brevibacillus brevis TaxID=1393 RepID=A0A517I4D5_BREBE|nr:tyrosine-type recombinase/integrase [Brevibacillus brevis]